MVICDKADATTYTAQPKRYLFLQNGPSAAVWKDYVSAGGWKNASKCRVVDTRLARSTTGEPSFNGLLYKLFDAKNLTGMKRETEAMTLTCLNIVNQSINHPGRNRI